MWLDAQALDPINRKLVQLEQDLLAVCNGRGSLDELRDSENLGELWTWCDAWPYQAWSMARIKSGHAMTPRHGINVMLMARTWMSSAHRLGSRLDDFSFACLIHDVGHWFPPDLVYVFGRFTHDQARSLSDHLRCDSWSCSILSDEMKRWIGQHHEQPDGRGYPEGLTDPDLLAQVIRITDCFEGLTTPRRIRPVYSYREAMRMMLRWAGYKYRAGLFKSWMDFIGKIPVGTFVKLRDGEVAVMLKPEETARALVLTNAQGDVLDESDRIELLDPEVVDEFRRPTRIPLSGWAQGLRPDLMDLPRHYAQEN